MILAEFSNFENSAARPIARLSFPPRTETRHQPPSILGGASPLPMRIPQHPGPAFAARSEFSRRRAFARRTLTRLNALRLLIFGVRRGPALMISSGSRRRSQSESPLEMTPEKNSPGFRAFSRRSRGPRGRVLFRSAAAAAKRPAFSSLSVVSAVVTGDGSPSEMTPEEVVRG